jgi:DNA-binding NarL/FixJ family response regulator
LPDLFVRDSLQGDFPTEGSGLYPTLATRCSLRQNPAGLRRRPASREELMWRPPAGSRGPILVVDDDDGFRALITAVLDHCGYVLVEASSGEEALEAASAAPPALVVLDVHLPGISGYEVCRTFREEFGDGLPIIFVSGERTQSFDRVAGFLIGGDDYLVKPFALDVFVARVRRHLQRPARLAEGVGASLTKRELEVLRLLTHGLSQAEIARRLYVSPKTVGTHTDRLFKKLGAHSRAQAVSFAYVHGLLDRAVEQPRPFEHA